MLFYLKPTDGRANVMRVAHKSLLFHKSGLFEVLWVLCNLLTVVNRQAYSLIVIFVVIHFVMSHPNVRAIDLLRVKNEIKHRERYEYFTSGFRKGAVDVKTDRK